MSANLSSTPISSERVEEIRQLRAGLTAQQSFTDAIIARGKFDAAATQIVDDLLPLADENARLLAENARLTASLDEARSLANRWINASLEASPVVALGETFDPNQPEAWRAVVVRAMLALIDERDKSRAEYTRVLAENARLRQDAERLDAISVPGASTRVAMRALANQADPPMRAFATVSIPNGVHASCVSERRTLREAIDAARPPRSTGE